LGLKNDKDWLPSLDLRDIAPAVRRSVGKEAAVLLKEALDRTPLPPETDWPDLTGDPDLRKLVIPNTEIVLIRIKDGPREGEFVFSSDSVARAMEFYERVEKLDYVRRQDVTAGLYLKFMSEPGWMIPRKLILSLPSPLHERWFGQAIWQWIGLVAVLLLSAILMMTLYLIGRRRAKKLRANLVRYLFTLTFPVLAMLVPLGARYFVVEQLQIYGELVVWISVFLQIIFLLGLVVLLLSFGSRLADAIIATPWVAPSGLDAQLTRLVCRLVSMLAALIALLEGGRNLGIPLTTLLTGAGVGGLAIALAAQDTLSKILGSMMIMLDKPYRVGERIVAKGYDGVVDEIGLRSTKFRLLNGNQVTIANEEMAGTPIENIGRSPFIRNTFSLKLEAGMPAAKVKEALEILKEILDDHEAMKPDFPPRVYLKEVNEGAVDVFVAYWYHSTDYWAFLEFGEKVQLQIAERFETSGIQFAEPPVVGRLLPES